MAGVLLITVPAKNQSAVQAAEIYVQDGIEYQTIEIPGDRDPEASKVIFNSASTGNYRYILMDDWNLAASKVGMGLGNQIEGNAIILDLNGHVVTATDSSHGSYYFYFVCHTLELTDSSLTGGNIDLISVSSANVETLIVSGNGSYVIMTSTWVGDNVIVRGAKYFRLQNYEGNNFVGTNFTVAPYMKVDWQSGNYRDFVPTHDYYTVSTRNDLVTGVYNYEYSLASELTVGELANLVVHDAQTYYLWGRKAGGWYEYLDSMRYTNGAVHEVIYLWGNSDPAQSKALFQGTAYGNYYYILMADWDLKTTQSGLAVDERVYGDHLVLDLNGHNISCYTGSNGSYYLVINCHILEVTDSADIGGSVNIISAQPDVLIVSGSGSYTVMTTSYAGKEIIVRNARYLRLQNYVGDNFTETKFTVASHMKIIYQTANYRDFAPM